MGIMIWPEPGFTSFERQSGDCAAPDASYPRMATLTDTLAAHFPRGGEEPWPETLADAYRTQRMGAITCRCGAMFVITDFDLQYGYVGPNVEEQWAAHVVRALDATLT